MTRIFLWRFNAPKGCRHYFTQTSKDREENGNQYITIFSDGATTGFQYFEFNDNEKSSVTVKGTAEGKMVVKDGLEGTMVAMNTIKSGKTPQKFTTDLHIENGVHPLYFIHQSKGFFPFPSIETPHSITISPIISKAFKRFSTLKGFYFL